MSVILNGKVYSDEQFRGYGYAALFPETIFTDMLVEMANHVNNLAVLHRDNPGVTYKLLMATDDDGNNYLTWEEL